MMHANYLAGVFHHYLEQIPEISSPNGMGLKVNRPKNFILIHVISH